MVERSRSDIRKELSSKYGIECNNGVFEATGKNAKHESLLFNGVGFNEVGGYSREEQMEIDYLINEYDRICWREQLEHNINNSKRRTSCYKVNHGNSGNINIGQLKKSTSKVMSELLFAFCPSGAFSKVPMEIDDIYISGNKVELKVTEDRSWSPASRRARISGTITVREFINKLRRISADDKCKICVKTSVSGLYSNTQFEAQEIEFLDEGVALVFY